MLMLTSDRIKAHPQLAQVISALLDGVSLQEIASRFGLIKAELEAYRAEAGLDPQVLGEQATPAEDSPSSESAEEEDVVAQGDDPDLNGQTEQRTQRHEDLENYPEKRHERLQQLLEARQAEQEAYEAQAPRPVLRLVGDEGFRPGYQPQSRLMALVARQQAEKARRLAFWKACPWNWRQPVPPELR
jgi:hypothetical protein